MQTALIFLGVTIFVLLAMAALLKFAARFGRAGRAFSEAAAYAPLLDVFITYFVAGPVIAAVFIAVCIDSTTVNALLLLASAIVAQLITFIIWANLHERLHRLRTGAPRPKISRTMDAIVGRTRNVLAVWWTMLAVPLFILVRIAEIVVYPPLTWLVRLPKYRHCDWVNVSRHKFDGLVGYDLLWCLYCDWMTGVWSLGGEMLRNVESFWCPIRFSSTKKCENCKVDFPDINRGWVDAGGTTEDVVAVLREKYPGPAANTWFGHPARLTVEGKVVAGESDM